MSLFIIFTQHAIQLLRLVQSLHENFIAAPKKKSLRTIKFIYLFVRFLYLLRSFGQLYCIIHVYPFTVN